MSAPAMPIPMPIAADASTNEGLNTRGGTRPFENLNAMVAAHETRISRFLLVSVRDRDLAQTLCQETFLRAWSTRESFRGECAPQTWLMRIAVNLVRDHTRTDRFRFWKQAARTQVDATEVSTWLAGRDGSAERTLILRQQVEGIWETVETLSGRQRVVFLLRFLEEMELPEIAEAIGLPVSTVKSHLYRALNTVRARHADAGKGLR